MSKVYLINAKRTAIGKFLGSLYEKDPADVCSQVIQNGFKREQLNDVEMLILGNVISAGCGQGLARKIAVMSKLCGGGV
jgi:acetyl-CoA C-acetyltransferase